MHTAAHIPLKQCATALGIDIKILLIALNNQFLLAITVKVSELVALPVSRPKLRPLGSIFGLDEVMINSGTHMAHINASEQTVPVSIVSLCLPQMHYARFCCTTDPVYCIVNAQHYFMLVINLVIAHQEVPPEAAAHKLQDILAFLVL